MKYHLSESMCLDIYLSSLSDEAYTDIKEHIKPPKVKSMPLLSWDIFSEYHFQNIDNLKTELDIKMVKLFAEKENLKNDFDSIFENQDFEALIITDINQKIRWVNDGFTQMTGYSKTFALNKTPRFLQGINTSEDEKKEIRNKLIDLKPFTTTITNYRKDNTPYKCEVKIIPLYSEHVTHFLAIERQVI